jgi:two-component system, OmpR family, phosphate regulon sensor histidine kinase PhoR
MVAIRNKFRDMGRQGSTQHGIAMRKRVIDTLSDWRARLRPVRGAKADLDVSSSARGEGRPAASGREEQRIAGARSLIEALPDAALVLDSRRRVLAANTAASETLGHVAIGEHIGRTARQPELSAALDATLERGQRSIFEIVIKSPTERHLDGAVTRLTGFGNDPAAPALFVILQDISEREALARMRMEFVANASHELRTPLAAVAGFIETLRGPAKNDPAAQDRFLTIMSEQASRMTRLIDDLLVLSRVEMRAHLVPSTVADLNHVATEAVRLATAQATVDGATLRLDLTETDMKVPGDHDELMQAAQNLILNALKYGRAAGTVSVRTTRERDRRGNDVLRFSVSDDGPGIAAEHLPRLTERFYRVNTAASREKGGTGLGLAIVKHIAVRHRGRVEVQSIVGKGSTFSLVLPIT